MLLAAALACTPRAGFGATPFTLEQVRSYAFPQETAAAANASHVAWLVNDHGRRNVWVASGPQFEARQLTTYTEDDGQELSSLRLSDDGSEVVYVRGGDPGANWDGGLPINPASQPGGTKVEIWSVPFSGGTPRRISEGGSPAISPDGHHIAFVKDDTVWMAAADGAQPANRLLTLRSMPLWTVRSTRPRWKRSSSPGATLLSSSRMRHEQPALNESYRSIFAG